jgi:excisionase family DNA binding protein
LKEENPTQAAARALFSASGYDPARIEQAMKVLNGELETGESSPLLLNQKEAARLLGVSRYTVRRLHLAGRLEVVRISGSLWFRRRDILHLAEFGEKPPAPSQ